MQMTIELDASNRIVLSRNCAGGRDSPDAKVIVSATPGRIVLEMEANSSGRIVKRATQVWTALCRARRLRRLLNNHAITPDDLP